MGRRRVRNQPQAAEQQRQPEQQGQPSNSREWFWKRLPDITAQFIIAAATVVTAYFVYDHGVSLKGQLDAMQKQAGLMAGQLVEMKRTSDQTVKVADAAVKTADAAVESLRARLSPDIVRAASVLNFSGGGLTVALDLHIQNTGRLASLNGAIFYETILRKKDQRIVGQSEEKRRCDDLRKRSESSGFQVLGSIRSNQRINSSVTPREFQAGMRIEANTSKRFIFPTIFGCIRYRFARDQDPVFVGFTINISREDDGIPARIYPNEGAVTIDAIRLEISSNYSSE